MITSIILVALYEVITTVLTLLGLKALSSTSLDKRMAGLNQPKRLPLIDRKLNKLVGPVSKREAWVADKTVKAINNLTKYRAFRMLVILGKRRIHENLAQDRSRLSNTRRLSVLGRL